MILLVPVKGYFEENCYFYVDDATGHGFVIDPGAQAEKLLQTVRQRGWTIEKILLTHGHFDHMGAACELSQALGASIYAHENAGAYLLDPVMNLSIHCGPAITVPNAHALRDGDEVRLQADLHFALRVLHTPGHTADSITLCSLRDGVAFVGDTIFRGSLGNYSYPGGNLHDLKESIAGRIFRLPEDTVLLSGHSAQTTVGEEKRRCRSSAFLMR